MLIFILNVSDSPYFTRNSDQILSDLVREGRRMQV